MKVDDTTGRLLVVSGPSGAGKTALVEAACRREPSLQKVPTATTRSRRADEVDGGDYLFMDEEEFAAREREGFFLETARVHGNLYGTPKGAIDAFLEHGLIPVVILDPKGAEAARAAYPGRTVSVFVDTDDKELRHRLEMRGDADVERRMADADMFREHKDEYNAVLLNERGCLAEAVRRLIRVCQEPMSVLACEIDEASAPTVEKAADEKEVGR